jgi:hypothetical protein
MVSPIQTALKRAGELRYGIPVGFEAFDIYNYRG